MSAPVTTDPAVLTREAANFERISGELKNLVARVESTAAELANHWQGTAATAAQSVLERYRQAASQHVGLLNGIATNVHSAGVRYSTVDEEQASQLASKMSMQGDDDDKHNGVQLVDNVKQAPPGSPQMPPPPPDPSVPNDVARYNSQSGFLDKAKAEANKLEAKTLVKGYFNAKGFELSNTVFDHYLENSGAPFVLPPSAMTTIVNDPQVRPTITNQANDAVSKAAASAAHDPSLYGVPQAVVSPYSVVMAQNNDVTNADGHFSVATTALVTVQPPGPDGKATYSIQYQTHMYDYYYFHQSEQGGHNPVFGAKQSVDADMRQLEAAGWAKSFKVHGSSGVVSATGSYGG